MKERIFRDKNYKAIYFNGKTIRLAIDNSKPILELDYPEFYDVKITGYCQGNCPYCYQNSLCTDSHYSDVLKKIYSFFGSMSENQRPFQVALGGGNPNQHPEFIKILELFDSLGIVPNYTTNGMGLTEEILEATNKYCGGVAVSCHSHLQQYWERAVRDLFAKNIKVNLHIIISDKESIDKFVEIYNNWQLIVDYFVLLPYEAAGRAEKKDIAYDYLTEKLKEMCQTKIAFGANFYKYLQDNQKSIDVSLYEPEIMSKYLDLSDMSMYKSSFNLTKIV